MEQHLIRLAEQNAELLAVVHELTTRGACIETAV